MYETFQKRPSTQEVESNYYPEQVLPATSIVTNVHDLGQAQNLENEKEKSSPFLLDSLPDRR
jgi:hypothetical protein